MDDLVSTCQLLSIVVAALWARRSWSTASLQLLASVVACNALVTGFMLRMPAEGVTWHALFHGQVDGDTVTRLIWGGFMYAGMAALLIGFLGLQAAKAAVIL